MTVLSSAVFAGPAAAALPRHAPSLASVLALAALGIVNTGLAYWLFYLLIDEAGAASAAVITYVMPVVALVLGVAVLGEGLTAGAVAGLVLIGLGAWLATTRPAPGGQDPRQSARILTGTARLLPPTSRRGTGLESAPRGSGPAHQARERRSR